MTKCQESSEQLSLDLESKPQSRSVELADQSLARPNVVTFADRATIAIRKDAINRVQASGIFEIKLKA
jgi:hypothetical protein